LLPPGTPAPLFQLPTLAGDVLALTRELKNGPVLLVFFKISCPTCQFTLPYLEQLFQSVGTRSGKAPQIIGISQDDAEGTREFNEYFGVSFPVLLDEEATGYAVSNAYRITHVPSWFLVLPEGAVERAETGFHRAELERLGELFGQSPFQPGERVPAFRPG
jgi:peroxiredoxin